MSDTSLGMHAAPPTNHENHVAASDRFHQQLQRLALYQIVGIVIVGAATLTAATTTPSIAVPVTAISIVACVGSVVVLMFWTIARAPAAARVPLRPPDMRDTTPADVESADRSRHDPSEIWFVPQDRQSEVAGRHHDLTDAERHDERHDEHREAESPAPTTDTTYRHEMWVNLARSLQTLLYRAIKTVDGLENKIEDPEILEDLWKIDNLITLARRKAENIAVLGGDPPQRRSNNPVELYKALIASVSEVERFDQIAIRPITGSFSIQGYVATEIVHLLAELLENATQFTNPDNPKVEVQVCMVTAGLAIEIQDRGLGLEPEALRAINDMLNGTATPDTADNLSAGHTGLAVVQELGHRNGVAVELQRNIWGGVAAVVVLPRRLLFDPTAERSSVPALALASPPSPLPPPSPAWPPGTVASAPTPATATTPHRQNTASGRHSTPARISRTAPTGDAQRAQQDPPRKPRPSPNGYPPGEFAPVPTPPALPQRNRSYMHPGLQAPAPAPGAVPGHNTALFANAQEGRDAWATSDAPGPNLTPPPSSQTPTLATGPTTLLPDQHPPHKDSHGR